MSIEILITKLKRKQEIRNNDKYYNFISKRAKIGNGLLLETLETLQFIKEENERLNKIVNGCKHRKYCNHVDAKL